MKAQGDIIIDGEVFAPGQSGVVRLFVSRLASGTRININTHVFRSEHEGPTVLIMGGVHGDEINGIQIVRRLLEEKIFDDLRCGNVIAIPLLNVFGFNNFSRDVPDGKDVNRSFPGSKVGSLASRTAAALTKQVLPAVDIAIDLHTGGAERYNHPQIRYTRDDVRARELAEVFAPPFLIAKPMIPKSFRKTAYQQGIPVMVYEAGESVRINGHAIQCGVDGIKRVLKHLMMIKKAPSAKTPSMHINSTTWVRASDAGLFTWTRKSGQYIRKGEELGTIDSPNADRTKRILAKGDGYIIGHNNASVVHNGDALFNISYE